MPICRPGRCITRGWNGIGSNYSSNTQIFQSPGYVVILQELIHEPRIIPLDGREGLPAGVKQWLGVSRGRWEGDTLVVETRNFDPRSSYRSSSPDLVLTERYTRGGGRSTTLHDPAVYARLDEGRPMRPKRSSPCSVRLPRRNIAMASWPARRRERGAPVRVAADFDQRPLRLALRGESPPACGLARLRGPRFLGRTGACWIGHVRERPRGSAPVCDVPGCRGRARPRSSCGCRQAR